MSRPLTSLAAAGVALVAAASLGGCGNARTQPPALTTPKPPKVFGRLDYRHAGVSLRVPATWERVYGQPPLVTTLSSGRAMLTVWRYARSEPLPATTAQLRGARAALVRAAQRRDRTLAVHGRLVSVDGVRGVQLVGTETVAGQPRRVRSTHLYAHSGEVVVDALAAPRLFAAADRAVFAPVLRSLRLSAPG